MSTTYGQLPNPYTPLAFLPPDGARMALYGTYAMIGSLATLSWDILLHMPQDYKLLTQCRINISLIVYFFSRMSTFAYVLGFAIIESAPINNCKVSIAIYKLFPLTVPSTTLLFVFRVCALYDYNKYITTFFSLSWLLVLGFTASVPIGNSAVNIGTTKYCVVTRVNFVTPLAIFYPLFHETLVFLATAWAFQRNSYTDTNFTNGCRVMVMGKFLPAFSKSLLHDGQAFYLVHLLVLLAFAVAYYDRKLPQTLITLLGGPAFVLLNNVSCHIYRNVRLGIYRDYSLRTSAISEALRGPVLHRNQQSSASGSAPMETASVRSTRSVHQGDTGTQVEGDLHELEVIHTRSTKQLE